MFGNVMSELRKLARAVVVGLVLVVVGVVIVSLLNPPSPAGRRAVPSRQNARPASASGRQEPADAAWRAALAGGDGNDWVQLSDRDKTALCLKAAGDLGKGERHARTYRTFLDGFYRRPSPNARSWSIIETIGVCQVSIDNGTIGLD